MRVAVTTSGDRTEQVAEELRRHRLIPVALPCIGIEGDETQASRARVLAVEADWIVVTSARAVTVTWPEGMPPLPVAAVGPAAARAVTAAGGEARLVGTGGAADLVERLVAAAAGSTVVFPHAAGADPAPLARLIGAGIRVHSFPVYRTLPTAPGEDPVDAALFASPSAVAGWLLGRSLDGPVLAAIGQTTAAALTEAGHPPQVVPDRPGYSEAAKALQDWTRERTSR